MSINLTDDVLGIWQFEIPESVRRGNYLAALTDLKDGTFQLDFRFRYYVDELYGPESKDEHSWYQMKLKGGTPAEAIEKVRAVVGTTARIVGASVTEILSEGRGASYLMERMKGSQVFTMTQVPSGNSA